MSLISKSKLMFLFGMASAFCGAAWAQTAPKGIAPIPTTYLPFPSTYTNGSKIHLQCGVTYTGTVVEASNFTGISIETDNVSSTCPRAVITPASPVRNWQVYTGSEPIRNPYYSGTIYVADAPMEMSQVFLDGQLQGVAHYPDNVKETGWLKVANVTLLDPATKQVTTSLDPVLSIYQAQFSGLPSRDIVGAKATYRGPYPWAIGTRTIEYYSSGDVMTLSPQTDPDLYSEDSPMDRFYLEGKLWMVNQPGEWAWKNGKLYIMMPPGQSPEGRILATPINVNATINARGTTLLTLRNVRILGGRIGVDGGYTPQVDRSSLQMTIINTEIAYSNWAGIYASGAAELDVDGSQIYGSLHTGIYARTGVLPAFAAQRAAYWASRGMSPVGTIVRNSQFTDVNAIGMHKGSDGTIYLNSDNYASITGNNVTNSGKSGIFVGQSTNSVVQANTINGACVIHGDCGGIYLFSRGKVALNTRVEGNTVLSVTGDPVRPGSTNPERYGIYLDDYATGTNIIANTIKFCDSGMQLHMAFNNKITSNLVGYSAQRDFLFSDDGLGNMYNNVFNNNVYYGSSLIYDFRVTNPLTAATFLLNNYNNVTGGALVSPSYVPLK